MFYSGGGVLGCSGHRSAEGMNIHIFMSVVSKLNHDMSRDCTNLLVSG